MGDSVTVVSLAHLTKCFSGQTALDDVSFSLCRGQFLAVIGLSGSGKSTLLRLVNGLHTPTSGSVEVLGVDVVAARGRDLRALRSQVGFIFQQFNLVGRVTCLENVLSGALGRLRGPRLGVTTYSKTLRNEALDHLERIGLGHKAFQRADTLSGGEQQRVAIARSLMQQPQILLADEPVASLDPESSGQVMDVLRRICVEDRLSVICSLHQVDMALGWAHRVIGLRAGRTVLDRSTDALTRADVMRVYERECVEPPAENRAIRKGATAEAHVVLHGDRMI